MSQNGAPHIPARCAPTLDTLYLLGRLRAAEHASLYPL
jgi:hypothetical protein